MGGEGEWGVTNYVVERVDDVKVHPRHGALDFLIQHLLA